MSNEYADLLHEYDRAIERARRLAHDESLPDDATSYWWAELFELIERREKLIKS